MNVKQSHIQHQRDSSGHEINGQIKHCSKTCSIQISARCIIRTMYSAYATLHRQNIVLSSVQAKTLWAKHNKSIPPFLASILYIWSVNGQFCSQSKNSWAAEEKHVLGSQNAIWPLFWPSCSALVPHKLCSCYIHVTCYGFVVVLPCDINLVRIKQ